MSSPRLSIVLPSGPALLSAAGEVRTTTPHLVRLLKEFETPEKYEILKDTDLHETTGAFLAPLRLSGPPGWWFGHKGSKTCNETIFEKLHQDQLRLLQSSHAIPAFDNLGEGRSLNDWWLEPFMEKLSAYHIDAERTIWLTQNIRAGRNLQEWQQKNEVRALPTPYGFHSSMGTSVASMRRRFGKNMEDLDDMYEHARATASGSAARPFAFLCLNRRMKPHRVALALHLIRQGHDKRGKLSLIETGGIANAERNLKRVARPAEASALARYWANNAAALPKFLDLNDKSAFGSSRAVGPIKPFYAETYFSIVTESNFVGENVFRFTEKTWKPIAMFHPFVLLGPAGLIRELRRLGFQTFHPLIDETYDDETDDVARFELVTREIDRLLSVPIDTMAKLYADLWPAIEHNHRHLLDFAPKYISARVDDLRVVMAGLT